MIGAVLIIFLLILVLMMAYILKRISKFSFLRNKKVRIILHVLILIVFILFMILDMVNIIVVTIYMFLFSALVDLITLVLSKILKKSINYDITGVATILVFILYLSYAYFLAHNIVQTNYKIETNKNVNFDSFRIVQISDTHVWALFSGKEFDEYMSKINDLKPDIVVITGDFIDDDTKYNDMVDSCNALGKIKSKYGVYFSYGNHDKGYFNKREYTYKDLEQNLEKNNVVILEDKGTFITDNMYIIGRKDTQEVNRLSMSELIKNVDKDNYIVVLDHEPNDFENEKNSKVDLVLSGHTHGGQLFPLGYVGVALGMNDMFYSIKKIDNTTFIVNSGMGDWAIKFKTHTIAEYVVVDIINNS